MNELVRFALVAFYPRVGSLPGLAELDVDARVANLRRESAPLFWFGIVAASLFFQLTPVLTVGLPVPAVLLTPEQLDRHANEIVSHRVYVIRQILVLLKLVGGMFWGESPEVRAFVGMAPYPPDPGTRRTEPFIARPVAKPRAPVDALVQLGRRERERGRAPEPQSAEGVAG